jgi:hypothetical protein
MPFLSTRGFGSAKAYGFTSGPGRTVLSYTFSANTTQTTITASALTGYKAGKSDITITVSSGVYLYSTSTASPALTITGASTGDKITLVNNGFIMGMGGAGGYAAVPAYPVGNGGPAISLGYSISLINNSYIGGGGGGGNGAVGAGGAGGGNAGGSLTYAGQGGGPGSAGGNGGTSNPNNRRYSTNYGGGGGRIMPGTGGSGFGGYGTPGTGGGAGGGGGHYNTLGSGGNGGSGGAAGSNGGGSVGGGGGGGWGAAGGLGTRFGNYAGGAGGNAVTLNGYAITYIMTGTIYGAVA